MCCMDMPNTRSTEVYEGYTIITNPVQKNTIQQ